MSEMWGLTLLMFANGVLVGVVIAILVALRGYANE